MAFTFTDTPTLRKAQTISVWSLHEAQPLHRYAIELPGKVYEVTVSPDGERAAWLLQGGTGKIGAMALWVSKLDGSGLHKVGNFGAGGKMGHGSGMDFPVQVVWVPGGKRVSFLYGGGVVDSACGLSRSTLERPATLKWSVLIALLYRLKAAIRKPSENAALSCFSEKALMKDRTSYDKTTGHA